MPMTTTTEITLRDGVSTAIVSTAFAEAYPGLAPDDETLELLEENLDGGDFGVGDLVRVKVPAEGLQSWIVPDGGKQTAVEEIEGILLVWKPRRSFWLSSLTPGSAPDGSAPDCHSLDNKHPVSLGLYGVNGENAAQNPSHLCSQCPQSQWGTKGNAIACREQRLLFILREGALVPIVIHVPPTSLQPLRKFMFALVEKRKKFAHLVIRLKLVPAKSKAGQGYNRIEFSTVRELEEGEIAAVEALQAQFKPIVDRAMTDFTPDVEDAGLDVGGPEA